MAGKSIILAFVLSSYIIILPTAQAQIPPEEVTPDLKFILNPELDEWKSPEELQGACPYYLSGFDEENRPIWVLELGIWPTRDILAKGEEWEVAYDKHVDQMFKRIYDSVGFRATPENPVKEFNLIVDLDEYTIRHFSSVKAVRFATRKFQLVTSAAKYGRSVFLVNTNSFAQVVIGFLKPVLGSALERVEIFGTNSKSWVPKLLKALPKDELSEKYGGYKSFKPIRVYG